MKHVCWLILVVFWSHSCWGFVGVLPGRARDTAAVVMMYRTRDGLPHSEVTSIHRDGHSVMWFGTRGGLARYDGEQFISFSHDPCDSLSIGSNDIRHIAGEGADGLWIGTSAGVSRYLSGSMSFRNYAVASDSSLGEHACGVWSVHVDRSGRVWLLSSQALGLLDTVTGRVRQFPYPPHRGYAGGGGRQVLVHDAHNRLWVLWGRELLLFDVESMMYVPDDELGVILSGIGTSGITGLALQGDGSIWVSRSQDLYHFVRPGVGPLAYRLPLSGPVELRDVGGLFLDSEERPWCRVGKSFFRLSPDGGEWLRVSSLWENGMKIGLPHFDSYNFEDSKNYWLSADGGVVRWHQSSRFIRPYSHRTYGEPLFPCLDVRSIYTWDDRVLWVGSFGGGVSLFDRHTGRVVQLPRRSVDGRVSLDTVHGLLGDRWGRVLAIAPGGVALYDSLASCWRNALAGDWPLGGLELRCGAFWDSENLLLGGMRGLWVLNLRSGALRREVGLDSLRIVSLLPTEGGVYLAGERSLALYDMSGQVLQTFSPEAIDAELSNPESLVVQSLAQTEKGEVYIGTNRGMYRYAQGGFRRVGQRTEQIPQNIWDVRSLLVGDRHVLWNTSTDCIGEYAWDDEDFFTYGMADMVDVGDYNLNAAYRSGSGMLYFGARGGLVSIDPRCQDREGKHPEVILSRCIAENGTSRLTMPLLDQDTIAIPQGYNAVTLSFAMLDYSTPGGVRYQYIVEGLAEDWRDLVGGNTITVANLPYGTVTVRFRASNREGIWQEGHEYTLVVPRTPLQVVGILVRVFLVLLVGACLVWSVLRMRRRSSHGGKYRSSVPGRLSPFKAV